MGRKKPNKSLKQQVKEVLDNKLRIGQSKYRAKLDGTYTQHIYAWETYRSYLKHCCYFVEWAKLQPTDARLGHKPRTLPEVTAHALRHTNASLMINSGIDLKAVSSQLGHCNINITANTYGHIFDTYKAKIAKSVEDKLL